MIKKWVIRHPFWAFYLIAFSLSTLLFSYVMALEVYFQIQKGADYSFLAHFMLQKQGLIERYPALFHHKDSIILYLSAYVLVPLGLPMFFFPFAPSLAALVATQIGHGGKAIKALLSLYKPIQGSLTLGGGLKVYLLLISLLVTMTATACLREYYWGDVERNAGFLNHLGLINGKIFVFSWLMALFFNQGGLLEELGWRGYALPLLIRRWQSPLVATLLLGIAWALWHFPREIGPLLAGQQSYAQLLTGQFWFILSCCSVSVIATYFVNITGGSVLPAIMIHGTFNMVGGMFSTTTVGVRSEIGTEQPIMWLLTAIVLLLFVGKDLGWQRRLYLCNKEV